jgi:scyllo-inositol 2-dehydrogenase (NADP+)
MRNIGVGIIGYGLAGSVFHAPLVSSIEGFTLRTIVSSNPDKVKADYPTVAVVPTLDELLADPAIELVVIAAPNTAHFPLAKQALLANRHVVVDKPFTNTVQEADELIQLAAQKSLLLSVFQSRRWDNDFLTLKACIQGGLLGDIYSYEAHYDRYRPQVRPRWREKDLPGSGMLYDLGAHLIDQALALFGSPQTIFADLQAQRPGSEVVDYFHLLFGYASGLRVILHSGSIVRKPGPHFLLHGTKGSFTKYGLDSQEDALRSGIRPGQPGWGLDKAEFFGEFTLDNDGLALTGKIETLPGCYEAYYQQLFLAINEGQALPVRAEEARQTINIIEKAMQSSQEKRVIPLV